MNLTPTITPTPTPTPTGQLSVTTNPTGTNIYLNYTYRGTANPTLWIYNLTPGMFITTATKTGYNNATAYPYITGGQTTYLTMNLTPTATPTPTPTPAPNGTIIVSTNPANATIFLNGTYKGLTYPYNITITNVIPGNYLLNATKAGYIANWTYTYVVSGQTTYNYIFLSPA